MKKAVGYLRVSTEMQAKEGLSLEAQRAAIERYCAAYGLELVALYKDVTSGASRSRRGLQAALSALDGEADVLVVLKFDRLSRSLSHFCSLIEQYFSDGKKELIALQERIQLDSWIGRALVALLMVFAQMEREAAGDRTRAIIGHIRRRGYHFGKVPYGRRAVPAADEPRHKVLVDNPDEQAVLARIEERTAEGFTAATVAGELNADRIPPPRGENWTAKVIFSLRRRHGHSKPRPQNERPHTDQALKERLLTLRGQGLIYREVAAELNKEGWVPAFGKKFTQSSVARLLYGCDEVKVLTPRRYCELQIERLRHSHEQERRQDPFFPPSTLRLAQLLTEAGYATPRGHRRWHAGQVWRLLAGHFDAYYRRGAGARPDAAWGAAAAGRRVALASSPAGRPAWSASAA